MKQEEDKLKVVEEEFTKACTFKPNIKTRFVFHKLLKNGLILELKITISCCYPYE